VIYSPPEFKLTHYPPGSGPRSNTRVASVQPLRFGILGAASIAPSALIKPARRSGGAAAVVAVAARDPERAQAFAAAQGIPRALGSYEALVADPEVDVVYNPLPNGLHGRWTLAALAAGKHVLCEKPFAANAEEAAEVAAVADASDRVVMEAFHYRYHPLTTRVAAIVESGELGTLTEVTSSFSAPIWKPGDIRYDPQLAGGRHGRGVLPHLAAPPPRRRAHDRRRHRAAHPTGCRPGDAGTLHLPLGGDRCHALLHVLALVRRYPSRRARHRRAPGGAQPVRPPARPSPGGAHH